MTSFFAIVRSSGECTASQCFNETLQQFPEAAMLHVSPFMEAVRMSLAIARESNAEWLVTIDADCMIRPSYRQELQRRISIARPECWHILGNMDCFIAGTVRQGGPRAWRISFLRNMRPELTWAASGDKALKRPESALFHAYDHATLDAQWITCSHGFDQTPDYYYRIGKNPKWQSKNRWHKYWADADNPLLKECLRGLQDCKADRASKLQTRMPRSWSSTESRNEALFKSRNQ